MSKLRHPIAVALLPMLAATLSGCGVSVSTTPGGSTRVSAAAPSEPAPTTTPTSEAPIATPSVEVKEFSNGLDAYVDSEASQIPDILEQFEGTYSDITIVGEQPDLIIFTYTFADALDPAVAVPALDDQMPQFEEAGTTIIFPAMEIYGVTPTQRMRFTYLNSDGSLLWSHDFTSE